mmetsp:Transcript_27309/g.23375  ORF Transcript_27309/g.23375 Transcript_27309/m.23375 type:complete len:81 (-) Transcript_27309:67-309(-)
MTIATNFGVCILSFNVTNSVATLVRDMAKPTMRHKYPTLLYERLRQLENDLFDRNMLFLDPHRYRQDPLILGTVQCHRIV